MPEFDFDSLNKEKKTTIISQTYELIITKDIDKDGHEYFTRYNRNDPCMSCGKEMYGSGESGGCVICDKVLTETELKLFLQLEKPTLKPSEIKEKIKEFKEGGDAKLINEALGFKENVKKEEKDAFDSVPIIPIVQDKKTIANKPQPKITKQTKKEEFPLAKPIINLTNLEGRKNQIQEDIELYKFMKGSVLDQSDSISVGNRKFIKKSGCQKLAVAFGLSVEIMTIETENELDQNGKIIDVHAHAKVRAIRPNGSYIEATGDKSKSEYYSEKYKNYGNYNLHNLRNTAATRATNRAILNAVGFGEVSAEEMVKEDEKDAFGGE